MKYNIINLFEFLLKILQTIVQKKTALNVKMVSVWIRSVTVTMDSEDVTVKFQVCATIYVIILLFSMKFSYQILI